PTHLRRAQCRPPQGRGRPQDLSRLTRVHGGLRPSHDRGGRPHRGRLLRHDARAHQEDARLRRECGAPSSAGGAVSRDDRHSCCPARAPPRRWSHRHRAHAARQRNTHAITGEPPKMAPYPEATAVCDIDSIGPTNLVYRLNHGLDPGNNPIGAPTKWAIGVGVNPGAVELDRELSRFHWKVDAGAEFAVTQPVFDVRQLESFLKRVETYRIPIVAGIWPLVSLRNAEFLANEVPGVVVPPEVLERMRRAQDKGKEAALAEGVKIAREMFQQVKGSVQGVQVSAPFGRVEVALEVFG